LRVWVPGSWEGCHLVHDGYFRAHHHWREGYWEHRNW
jgi:hypothetical protein